MGDVVPLKPNKFSIKRLACQETNRLNDLYRLSYGFSDPLPDVDPEILELVRLGIIEQPWR
jgi:hypothetical protein